MVTLRGQSKQILHVDMTRQSQDVWILPEKIQKMYLGGRSLGLYLYHTNSINPGVVDPLGTENLVVITLGLSTGVQHSSYAQCTVVTKSPQTDRVCVDTLRSPFATALRSAGWDGIIIRGVYPSPGIMEITPMGAQFHRAKSFWKCETSELFTQLEEQFGSEGPWGGIGIGTAGSHAIPVATLSSHGHTFGHGGMGAVLGAKKLKALVARSGMFQVDPIQEKECKQVQASIEEMGTVELKVSKRFWQKKASPMERFSNIQPYFQFQKKLPVQEATETPFFSLQKEGCSLEMLLGFGSELGNMQYEYMEEWSHDLQELGLSTRSMAHIIAWAMQADAQDIRNSYLKFDSYGDVQKAIQYVGGQRGIAKERNLGLGLRWLTEKFKDDSPIPSVDGGDLPAFLLPWDYPMLQWASSGTIASLYTLAELRASQVLTEQNLSPTQLFVWEQIILILDLLGLPMVLAGPLFLTPQGLTAKLLRKAPAIPQTLKGHSSLNLLANYGSAITGHNVTPEDLLLVAERSLVLEQQINYSIRITEGLEDELYAGKQYQKLLGLVGGEPTDQQLHRLHLDELEMAK